MTRQFTVDDVAVYSNLILDTIQCTYSPLLFIQTKNEQNHKQCRNGAIIKLA